MKPPQAQKPKMLLGLLLASIAFQWSQREVQAASRVNWKNQLEMIQSLLPQVIVVNRSVNISVAWHKGFQPATHWSSVMSQEILFQVQLHVALLAPLHYKRNKRWLNMPIHTMSCCESAMASIKSGSISSLSILLSAHGKRGLLVHKCPGPWRCSADSGFGNARLTW